MTAVAAFALSAQTFAVDNSTQALSAQVSELSAQTKQLQHEVWSLRHSKKAKKAKKAKTVKTENTANTVKKAQVTHINQNPEVVSLWHHYVTVTTVPYLARHLSYTGSDLLYNVSSMNEDLLLLQQKQAFETNLEQNGLSINHPIIQVSGALQAQFYSSSAFTPNSANGGATSGMALSTGELDFNATASSWATAFMALDFNGSPVSTGNRNPNSAIYLERGFLTLGNLNKAPIYFSMGEMYSPFGAYSTSMVSTPMTQSMMEIRTPTAVLGYSAHNIFASVYTYQGGEVSGTNQVFKQGGVDAGYKATFHGTDSIGFGTGFVSNIADSQGMQGTGYSTTNASYFSGFGATSTSNNLIHAVGGGDVNGSLTVGRVTLIGEYITALEKFSPLDLTYNSAGAQPSAVHGEVDYILPFLPKKFSTALGVSYDHTSQALALNLEQNKYAVFLNTNIWRETVESIEYNYQADYGTGDSAIGRDGPVPIVGTGRGISTVLVQFGVYF